MSDLLRPRRVLALSLVSALWIGCGGQSAEEGAPPRDMRPNILLITVESIRADHVGGYGYGRATTPSLDALAEEGIVFENAYAVTSWTLPSHASIFTGLYPAAHRVVDYLSRLDDSHTTLAEVLREAGYQTAGFISGPFLQEVYNLNQGFEIYDESTSNPQGNQAAHADVTNARMESLLTRFLREGRSADRPFFLFAYLWDPHYDYIPPPPYDEAFVPPEAEPIDLGGYETKGVVSRDSSPNQLAYVISQYDGEILWTDALLGRLWSLLDELNLWEDTAVVVTSDHGEEFFEHGTKGHRNNLYEESVRVPLILRAPGREPRRDGRIASLIDVFPSVLEIAGVEAVPPHHGRSLLRPAPEPQPPIFFELKTEWVVKNPATGERGVATDLWLAVRDGDHKLVLERNEQRRELYDLAEDPREKHSLYASHPERFAALDGMLGDHLEAMKRYAAQRQPSAPARLTPEQEERLRSLGYVDRSGPDD